MNRHERRALKATGDTIIKSGPRAMQKRIDLVRQHAQALEKAWANREDIERFHDPVLVVVDTDDVVGRRFTPPGAQPGGVLVGIASALELGTQLLEVEPDVYAKVRDIDTSRPYVVCIAHWGTTAGRPEAFGV